MSHPLVFALAFVAALLVASPAFSIVARHDAGEEALLELGSRFPAAVKLRRAGVGLRSGAEGTLVAPRWVLTAAHVAASLSPGDVAVTGKREHRIDRVVRHPGWKSDAGMDVDIALLRLASPVEGIDPAAPAGGPDAAGTEVVFVGRGGHGDGRSGPTGEDGRVRGATNRIEKVGETWIRFRFDAPGDPAATALEGISGPGDSGGPAFVERDGTLYVVGVSSGQDSKPAGGKPGRYGVLEYYTRVSAFASWIRSVISSGG